MLTLIVVSSSCQVLWKARSISCCSGLAPAKLLVSCSAGSQYSVDEHGRPLIEWASTSDCVTHSHSSSARTCCSSIQIRRQLAHTLCGPAGQVPQQGEGWAIHDGLDHCLSIYGLVRSSRCKRPPRNVCVSVLGLLADCWDRLRSVTV